MADPLVLRAHKNASLAPATSCARSPHAARRTPKGAAAAHLFALRSHLTGAGIVVQLPLRVGGNGTPVLPRPSLFARPLRRRSGALVLLPSL